MLVPQQWLVGSIVAEVIKRVSVVVHHNAFREALAMRLNQEEDLEVAWQAGSMTDTRDVHLDGVDVALIDPFLADGDGLELIREVSVANPNALALVLSHKLDPAVYHQALGPVRSRCSPRTRVSGRSSRR